MELRYDPQRGIQFQDIVRQIGIEEVKTAFTEHIKTVKPSEGYPFVLIWHGCKWRLTHWNEGKNVLIERCKFVTPRSVRKNEKTPNFTTEKNGRTHNDKPCKAETGAFQ